MLITQQPPAKLREVEAKESSGEEEEIMGDKARTLAGEWERESERAKTRSQEVTASNQKTYCFCY